MSGLETGATKNSLQPLTNEVLSSFNPNSLIALAHEWIRIPSPSEEERRVMEAAVHKLPIVATDVGATNDLFDKEAIIIPRDCEPQIIVRALLDILERRKISYSSISRGSWREMALNLCNFYDHIIES